MTDAELEAAKVAMDDRAQRRPDDPDIRALLVVGHVLLSEVGQLRSALRDARTELARWGWGDFHYGSQPQEQSVVDALAAIDRALGEP